MNKFDSKKQSIIENTADFILKNGLKNASLRNIAETLSTSNRMLLHYFKDKEEMMIETLLYITKNLINLLESFRFEKMSFANLMPYLYKALKMPEIKPYMQLCLELISFSSNNEEPYYSIARKIEDIFYNWIETAMIIEKNEDKDEQLSAALVVIEGFVVLNALNYDDKIEKAIKKISRNI